MANLLDRTDPCAYDPDPPHHHLQRTYYPNATREALGIRVWSEPRWTGGMVTYVGQVSSPTTCQFVGPAPSHSSIEAQLHTIATALVLYLLFQRSPIPSR